MNPRNKELKLSAAGASLIKKWEGLGPEYAKTKRIVAYLCPAGVPTIGWGHTGPDVKLSDVGKKEISMEEANRLFERDVAPKEAAVRALVDVPLTQNQFDALVSFTYNLGVTAFANSASVLGWLNQGRYKDVPTGLRKYVYSGKTKLQGLVKRREEEARLFAKP